MTIKTLDEAIRYFTDTLAEHPERDALTAAEAACAGVRRRFPVLYLHHLAVPDDPTVPEPFYTLPRHEFPDTFEGRLAGEILGALRPRDMLNPGAAALSPGGAGSPADLVPSFGIPLSHDRGAAAFTRSLDEMLQAPPPDPDTAGLLPEMRERIRRVKDLTPPAFKIRMPDMQGPFNLVHAMVGNDAFVAPLIEPEKFQSFMARVTDYWIAAHERLRTWIGPERRYPADRWARITECSVNMVSEDFYREHILPHDLRIARHFGAIWIHPCSGLHVFRVTLQELPNVAATEAGMMISRMAAPCVSVAEALRLIGDRPIMLSIGQELPEDPEAAFDIVRRDLDLHPTRPRQTYSYTGMFWRNKDRPMIRDLHQRLDEHWEQRH